MPIKTACPTCEKAYNLADSTTGKQVRCKHCGETFFVNEGGAAKPARRSAFAADDEERPRKRPSRDDRDEEDERPARKSRRDEDEEEESPRPRKQRQSKSNTGLVIGLVAGGVGLLLVGIIVTVVLLTGGSKFTVENFKKVRAGMSEREVIALIGAPTQSIDAGAFGFNTKTMVWRNREGEFTVTLMNGKVLASVGAGKRGDVAFNFGGNDFPANLGIPPNLGVPPPIDFPANPFGNQPRKANWDQLQIGMTEQQVIDLFGQPARNLNYDGPHVIHANVTENEVKGPDGRTKPVKKFTYFKGFGEMGFVDVTFVDGKVFKIKK